jgi:copper(I)-binding protein
MASIRLSILILLIACTSLGACSNDAMPPLVATDIEITEALPGKNMSAGYLSLTNNTDLAITLSRVVSPEFELVEIHESLIENGISKMRRIPLLTIPANATVTLERGGKHLMLMRQTVAAQRVTLNFHSGDTLLLGVHAPITPRKN